MNFYTDSNCIHAEIYTLHSRLLERRDYYEMARSGDFTSAAPGIKAREFIDSKRNIKEIIFENQIKPVITLAKTSPVHSWIFIFFLRFFELLNLKQLYAGVFEIKPFTGIWYNTGDFSVLHRDMLSENTGILSLLKYCQNTWMKSVVAPDSAACFREIDFSIDLAALRLAVELAGSISLPEDTGTERIISAFGEYFSVAWSWKFRNIYNLDDAEIGDYMTGNMPFMHYTGSAGSSVVEWEKLLFGRIKNSYADILGGGRAGSLPAEKVLEQVLMRELKKLLHENIHSVNAVVCSLGLLYVQIKNLFFLADGIVSGLDPELIMENIICGE